MTVDCYSLVERIRIKAFKENQPVQIDYAPEPFTCIGKGTDAAVFVHPDFKGYAFKVFAPDRLEKREHEEMAYKCINGNPYFPTFYGAGHHFIVVSYESGKTLYDCLLEGMDIPPFVMESIDQAIYEAKAVGLFPSDVHLKNIMYQGDKIKLLDLSEYVTKGGDRRFEHLKQAYKEFYPYIRKRQVPAYLLEQVKNMYNKQNKAMFSVAAFGRHWLKVWFHKDSDEK